MFLKRAKSETPDATVVAIPCGEASEITNKIQLSITLPFVQSGESC